MGDEYPGDEQYTDEEEKPSLAKQMGFLDRKPLKVEKNRPAPTRSALKYPIGQEPPLSEEIPPIGREKVGRKKESARSGESLLLRAYSVTGSTDGDLKRLSQILSQKAKKPISRSAIIRALVQLAAHDSKSIPKILEYVAQEEIKPGRK